MSRYNVNLPDLVIPAGGTRSNVLTGSSLAGIESLAIFAPDVLDATVTFTVQVAHVASPAAGDWADLQSGGTDVTLTADNAVVISSLPFEALSILASAAVAAERRFRVVGRELLR
jgi:hypothetical protein